MASNFRRSIERLILLRKLARIAEIFGEANCELDRLLCDIEKRKCRNHCDCHCHSDDCCRKK